MDKAEKRFLVNTAAYLRDQAAIVQVAENAIKKFVGEGATTDPEHLKNALKHLHRVRHAMDSVQGQLLKASE